MIRYWCVVAVGGLLLVIIVLSVIGKWILRVEVYSPTLWSAGTISNRTGNDIWFEYGPETGRIMAIYRDYDTDGYVDECVLFSMQATVVYRATSNNGLLDTMRDVSQPEDSTVRVEPTSPEAGPFTRNKLDDKVRKNPRWEVDR